MSDELNNEVVDRVSDDPRMPKVGDRVVDRYEVIRLLGEGGFAAVYLVKDTLAGGRLALKVLEPAKTYRSQYTDRFRQEVLLVRELSHPNTIKIYDVGTTTNGCPFFAMEYLEGEPLDALLDRTGGLAPTRARRIALQVLKSLAEAHGRQIIHRDLKPGNIMVCDVAGEEDFVKVLDFGIAKAQAPELKQVKTETGYLMCTPSYAAPELLRDESITPAADIYAMGLILAEMLTGRKALTAGSVYEIVSIQLSQDPVPLPEEILATPFGELLLRATAKDVERRYAHAKEMLEALEQVDWPHDKPLPVPETPVVGVSQELVQAAESQSGFHVLTPPSERVDKRVSKAHTLADPRFHKRDKQTRLIVFAALGITFVSMVTLAIVLLTNRNDSEVLPEPATVASAREAPEPAEVPPPVEMAIAEQQDGTDSEPEDMAEDVAEAVLEEPPSAVIPPPPPAEPPRNTVSVIISSEPDGAEVVFDGEVIGHTPFAGEIESEEEQVEVELRRRRYRPESVTIDMTQESQAFHERLRRERREEPEPVEQTPEPAESEEPEPESPPTSWEAVPRINIRPTEEQ